MESPYYEMAHDFEEENHIAERNFRSGYLKGYHDAVMKEQEHIIRCKNCRYGYCINPSCDEKEKIYECTKHPIANLRITHKPDWFCADGERKEIK